MDDLKEDYEIIRDEHYENLRERKYLSLGDARKKNFKIDWVNGLQPGEYFSRFVIA